MKAVIFDLDGTLIDSLEDLANSMNMALNNLNYKTHELSKYREFLGSGAMQLSINVLSSSSTKEEIHLVYKEFLKIYNSNIFTNTKVYDGIYNLLDELEKNSIKYCILSNKPHNFTLDYVNKYFSSYTFEKILGQKDNVPKKPNPQAAYDLAKILKIEEKNIYFVGDTSVDIQTAKNAGMRSIGVLWGFREKSEFIKEKADYIVKDCLELKNILLTK